MSKSGRQGDLFKTAIQALMAGFAIEISADILAAQAEQARNRDADREPPSRDSVSLDASNKENPSAAITR